MDRVKRLFFCDFDKNYMKSKEMIVQMFSFIFMMEVDIMSFIENRCNCRLRLWINYSEFSLLEQTMFTTLRKQSSRSRINTSHLLEPSPSDPINESGVIRRFTRTRTGAEEQTRMRKLSRGSEFCVQEGGKDAEHSTKMPKFINMPEDLFLALSDTPLKKSPLLTPATSDRTTDVSFMRQSTEREGSLGRVESIGGKEFLTEFRSEMQLKNGEVMLLEDEVMRLRKALLAREEEITRKMNKRTAELEQQIGRLRDELRQAKICLQQKTNIIKQQKNNENTLHREIKSLKYEKMLLEKQLQELYRKKLPKQIRETISYREQSLIAQVEQLKNRIQQSKTEQQVLLEQEVLRLKHQNSQTFNTINNLYAHSHILNKKISEKEMEFREKAESFGRCYSVLKEDHNAVLQQLKKQRKENAKLRKMNATKSDKQTKLAKSSSQESLTFSLVSNN